MSQTKFSQEAQAAIDLVLKSDENLFITGKAGTGKSTLLEHIREELDDELVVLAPTGIAAIHVKGETVHSFFKLKPGYELDEAKNVKLSKDKAEPYKALDTIIIDEISMVRADIMDAMDEFLRRVRKSSEHFGGVRMIFFGDLYQLPPVVTREDSKVFNEKYSSPYFFAAQVFKPMDLYVEPFRLKTIELSHVYRQKDETFVGILNSIRNNTVSQGELDMLNERVGEEIKFKKGDKRIHLMTTNAQVSEYNNSRLASIKKPVIEFKASMEGKTGRALPNDTVVQVKEGAQVMFIHNDFRRRWVNGTLGTVLREVKMYDEELDREYRALEVELEDGKKVKVSPHTWEISKYQFKGGEFKRQTLGEFTQIPLKLAWAITIHKSQGKTFQKAVIDLGRASFAHGQTYVALSRCTSLDGLVLKRPVKASDVIIDKTVVAYMNQ